MYTKQLLFLLFIFATASCAAETARPNILFIVADDLGWADVGWHDAKILTPNLDKLRREGVALEQHYVQPLCTPTRVALLSGRYPSRFGPQAIIPSNLRSMTPGTETLASALHSVGYETYLSGKWHLGSKPEWGPNQFGFQHSYGSLAGAADPWLHTYHKGPFARTWHRDGQFLDEEGNATELVAAQATKWIEEKHSPWFLYVPFQAVHIPIDTPDEYKKLYEHASFYSNDEFNASKRRYAAFVSQLDAKVGQLIDALEKTGQRQNTLVIFTSDNGGKTSGGNDYISNVPAAIRMGSNLPLRGEKGSLYEGGIRVPAFVNWAGRLRPHIVNEPMNAVDWFPTLTNLVGYSAKKALSLDGRDCWKLIAGEECEATERTMYWPFHKGCAIRKGDWKLILAKSGNTQLFNVQDDPDEKKDLSRAQQARVDELLKLLAEIQKADVTKLPEDLRGAGEIPSSVRNLDP